MKKHMKCLFAISMAFQASSIAAVRAEWSGNVAGETARNVSSDVEADNGSVASEDMLNDSSKAVAAEAKPWASPQPTLHNNNIINVETGSQARSDARNDARNESRNDNRQYQVARREEVALRGRVEELEYVERRSYSNYSVGITPMLGATVWRGPWKMNLTNDYSTGLALDFPVTSIFSIEAEGGYGSYQIAYATPTGPYGHRFEQYLLGVNGKLYLGRARFRPYFGIGMDAILYRGMNYGPSAPNGFAFRGYDQWIGAGQLLTGADFHVTEGVALGVRLTYSQPLINRPVATNAGVFAAPGTEEAAAIDTGFYRALGTVKVSF